MPIRCEAKSLSIKKRERERMREKGGYLKTKQRIFSRKSRPASTKTKLASSKVNTISVPTSLVYKKEKKRKDKKRGKKKLRNVINQCQKKDKKRN